MVVPAPTLKWQPKQWKCPPYRSNVLTQRLKRFAQGMDSTMTSKPKCSGAALLQRSGYVCSLGYGFPICNMYATENPTGREGNLDGVMW